MLTNASKYAIRAVLYIAINVKGKSKINGKKIAEELNIPEAFIAKILQKLVKSKIISSNKGPTGGFYMTKENLKKNINDIINTIEERDIFEECFLGLPVCSDKNPCPIHHIVVKFKEQINEKFQNLTIQEFADEIIDNNTYLSLKDLDLNIKNSK